MNYNKMLPKHIKAGDVFGQITVIEKTFDLIYINSKKNNQAAYFKRFKCICTCGREVVVQGRKLIQYERKRKVNRCYACAYQSRPQSTLRTTPTERLYNLTIKNRCEKSDGRIINKLSVLDFGKLISKDCYYCGSSPVLKNYIRSNKYAIEEDLYANGIDRVDNNIGYEIDNIVPCCKRCNTSKNDMTQEEFLNHTIKIYDYIKGKVDYE